jgi:2,5-furandicarboxylate decarboxylase 1
MQKGFREFLEVLERNGELKRLGKPVKALDTSAIISKSKQAVHMAVEGFEHPLVSGIVRDRNKVALALECEQREISAKVLRALENPLKPVMVEKASCQEVVKTGDEVDLTEFPIVFQHVHDGAPYIGSGVQVARSAKWGLNAGMYRHMFRTKNSVGIDLNSPSDLRLFFSEANQEGKALPFATAIGLHPAEMIAATYSAPTGVNEIEIAGALRGEPVELVKCKTIDAVVPANAELVLECEALPLGWSGDEGRYGEFHRVAGTMKHNPIVKIKAITHRKNPYFYSLYMPDEVYSLCAPLLEAQARKILEVSRMRPYAIRAPRGSCGFFELIVALDHPIPGEGKSALLALMSIMGVKSVTVVDEDIDIYDDNDLRWALSLRVQADQDVMIVSNAQAKHVDPTVRGNLLPPGRLPTTSKMGIDATIPPDIPRSVYQKASIYRKDVVSVPE